MSEVNIQVNKQLVLRSKFFNVNMCIDTDNGPVTLDFQVRKDDDGKTSVSEIEGILCDDTEEFPWQEELVVYIGDCINEVAFSDDDDEAVSRINGEVRERLSKMGIDISGYY